MRETELKTKKEKQREFDLLTKAVILPLIIGFSLVYAKLSIVIFTVIGWVLLAFGILFGSLYLLKLYHTHKERIQKTKEELLQLVKKDKVVEK